MSNQPPDWEEIAPPYAPIFALSMLTWLFISIFHGLDPTRYIFTGSMAVAALLSAYYLVYTRRLKRPLQNSSIGIFVVLWMGITSFTSTGPEVNLYFVSLKLLQVEFLVILPLAIIWAIPHNDEMFFGLKEITEDRVVNSFWKNSIIMMMIIRFFFYSGEWAIIELLILIPFVFEAYQLYQMQQESYPVLTLFIQQELSTKFAVPISMLRAVGVIMTAFMFGFLYNRFWLIIILLYFVAGIVWTVDFFIPLSDSNKDKNSINEKDIEDFIRKIRNDEIVVDKKVKKSSTKTKDPSKKRWQIERADAPSFLRVVNKPTSTKAEKNLNERSEIAQKTMEKTKVPIGGVTKEDETRNEEERDDEPTVEETAEIVDISADGTEIIEDSDDKEITISEKAHAFGLKVRNELQKPQYNLNHILSTLTQEDFSVAYRVANEGLVFNSYKGEWSPPKNLIIFPIELEEYDYRRVDQILLLGFNRPIEDKNIKFNVDFGEGNEYNTKISANSIRIGETIFNMKTLIIDREHWEDARPQLEIVTDEDDIEYTGFKTLQEMQDKLVIISDKWIEFRKQAQDAVINFLAGLFGAQEPIFLSRERIETELLEEGTYLIEDIDD